MMRNLDARRNRRSTRIITAPILVYFLLFFLGIWGCLAIYNATFLHDNPFHYAGRQLLWLLSGILVMYVISLVPFEFFRNNIPIIAIIFYIPLLLVLLFGVKINGMRGWFEFGSVFIQPSELAKGPFVLFLAWLALRYEDNSFKKFSMMSLATVLWIFPIAMEPDFGTLSIYVAAFLIVYWISGGQLRYIIISLMAFALFAIYYMSRHKYVVARLTGFWDPQADPLGSGWHICQFQYTLARGGLWGESWGNAFWANSYLPLSHSDSAFATLTEAIGFAGAVPVVLAVVVLVLVAYKLALSCEDELSKYYIFGAVFVFTVQSMLHVSVNVTMLPPTGITLPMLSYGGSSLMATMLIFGMMLSAFSKSESSKI